jgi:hypothetical protein
MAHLGAKEKIMAIENQKLRHDQHDELHIRDILLKGRRVREAADAVQAGDYITKRQYDDLLDRLTALQENIKQLQVQLNIVRRGLI